MSDEKLDANGNPIENNENNWDEKRQHADEMRAAGVREGTLQAQKDAAVQENERLNQAIADAEEAGGTGGNAGDTDPQTYEELVQSQKKLAGRVDQVLDENKSLRQTVEGVRQNANATNGQNELKQIGLMHEKRLGRNDLTNEVNKKVDARYKEQGIVDFPDAQRKAWIRQELELEYNRQNAASPKKPNQTESGVNLGGPGGDAPSGAVEAGNSSEVAEQIKKKYANTS